MSKKRQVEKFKRSTKAAIRRSFHPRELIVPSEKLEAMTAQSIYDGLQLLKRRKKKRR